MCSRSARSVSLASFLPPDRTERHVFRATVFSTVLTLAAGPEAALLCRVWCHPQAVAASACHEEKRSAASTVISGNDCSDCDHVGVVVHFLREDVRRGMSQSAPQVDPAVLVPRHQLAYSMIHVRPGQEPGREWSLERRPLPNILRI